MSPYFKSHTMPPYFRLLRKKGRLMIYSHLSMAKTKVCRVFQFSYYRKFFSSPMTILTELKKILACLILSLNFCLYLNFI